MSQTEAGTPPATPSPGLFRARALEQLASPDRIDLAARVVRPATWIALLSLALVLVAGLAGTALVRVPVQTVAGGLILSQAEPLPLPAAAFTIEPGELVTARQPIGRLPDGSLLMAPATGQVAAGENGAMLLLPTDGPVEAVVFMRPAQAAAVRVGMPARLAVESGVSVELHGHVAAVAVRPATVQAMARRLHDRQSAQQLAQTGATVELRVTLDQPAPPGIVGLLCRADIKIRERSVLGMLVPGLGD